LINSVRSAAQYVGWKIPLAAAVVVSVLSTAVVAGATTAATTSVSGGFTSLTTTLLGYLGDAVVMVLALVGISIGIRMLVRWAREASHA